MNKTYPVINNPLVSIIISVYNDEINITNALLSLKNQTYRNIEIIIINDGSTDGTLDLINKFIKSDDRFRLFSEINSGLTKSLNKAIKFCRGKYIARLDSDDISLPMRIECQVEFLESNLDISIVSALSKNIDSNLKIQISKFFNKEEIKNQLQKVNCITHSSVMIRASDLARVGIYNEDFLASQDYELWMRFLAADLRIAMIPEILIIRKITLNGISRSRLSLQARNSFLIRKQYSKISLLINMLLYLHQFIFGIFSNILAKYNIRK